LHLESARINIRIYSPQNAGKRDQRQERVAARFRVSVVEPQVGLLGAGGERVKKCSDGGGTECSSKRRRACGRRGGGVTRKRYKMELLPQNARPDVNADTMTVKARNLRAGPCRRDCSASDVWLLLLLLLLGRRRSVMPPSVAWAPAPAAFIPLRAAKSVHETAGNTHFMMDAAPTSGCTHTLHPTRRHVQEFPDAAAAAVAVWQQNDRSQPHHRGG